MNINQVDVTHGLPEVSMTGSSTQGTMMHPGRYATKGE
jgi:hypothetical protein